MEHPHTVTHYTIPGKSPVIVRKVDGFYCITLGKWLEVWLETAEEARDEAYKHAKIELVPIVWNADEPF